MAGRWAVFLVVTAAIWQAASGGVTGAEIFPPISEIKPGRPRLLIRPAPTPLARTLADLRAAPTDQPSRAVLEQLRSQEDAASQAMVWLLTDDRGAAEKAVSRLQSYRLPREFDTFHIYLRLTEFALAYDWLYGYAGLTPEVRREIREHVRPLAAAGLKQTDDHVFHNYIWMSAGGVSLWALAVAGEDVEADRLYGRIAQRMNRGLFPAMEYLDGLPSEPLGYWALYDFTPAALTLLAIQSASERDVISAVREQHGNWLERHFENILHSTLPDMRYVPWGDLQSGPNGGVTYSMAGTMEAVTWALRSPTGSHFARWLEQKRGLRRFYRDTAIYYPLYSRELPAPPVAPAASFLAGNRRSGHFVARSDWSDTATIVTFRSTDHFGDHNHYDQGSFIIYRQGLLAVDPPVYQRVRGPQQATEHHNTLLIGGQPQRPVRGQWFRTVEEFERNLLDGRKLETGDMPFYVESGDWAAASAQFAPAYESGLVASCVRQLLFVRPGTVVVVDQLASPAGQDLPAVDWLLQLPKHPVVEGATVSADNGKSWIRCRPLHAALAPEIRATPVQTVTAKYRYPPDLASWLVHALEVGDGESPDTDLNVSATRNSTGVEVLVHDRTYVFERESPHRVYQRE